MAQTDVSKIKNSLDKYVVRPLNFFGFGGFVFDVEGESSVSLTNEITDHYAEDNSTINDHIGIRPKRVTLKSYVGELSDIVNDEDKQPVQEVTRKLTTLSAYLPDLATAAQQSLEAIQQGVNEGVDVGNIEVPDQRQIVDIYAVVQNFIPPTTKQEAAYQYFKALRDQKILLSLQTPFEFMTNMAIETITATQGENTRFITDFTVTLKEVRFASTQIVPITKQGKAAIQSQPVDDRSTILGKEQDASVLAQIIQATFGGDE